VPNAETPDLTDPSHLLARTEDTKKRLLNESIFGSHKNESSSPINRESGNQRKK